MPRTAAFLEGVAAFETDATLKENPHPCDSRQHKQWADGWHSAQDDLIYSEFLSPEATHVEDFVFLFHSSEIDPFN